MSPLQDISIYFRLLDNNRYGFRAERNGKSVVVSEEIGLQPLIELALAIPKLKSHNFWLGCKWMERRYVDNLQLEELYQAATNEEVRARLFEEMFQEVTPYFQRFQQLIKHSQKIV